MCAAYFTHVLHDVATSLFGEYTVVVRALGEHSASYTCDDLTDLDADWSRVEFQMTACGGTGISPGYIRYISGDLTDICVPADVDIDPSEFPSWHPLHADRDEVVWKDGRLRILKDAAARLLANVANVRLLIRSDNACWRIGYDWSRLARCSAQTWIDKHFQIVACSMEPVLAGSGSGSGSSSSSSSINSVRNEWHETELWESSELPSASVD
jgi:hypothetical protein